MGVIKTANTTYVVTKPMLERIIANDLGLEPTQLKFRYNIQAPSNSPDPKEYTSGGLIDITVKTK